MESIPQWRHEKMRKKNPLDLPKLGEAITEF